MIRTRLPRRATGLAALFLTAGCASPPAPSPAADPPPAASAPSTDRLEALYRARMEEATRRVHPADVAFMSGMIHHHAQALVMSAWAPANGAGPAVLRLTSRIINAQRDEIRTMQQWLRDRGLPVPEVDRSGRMVMPPGAEPMHMPGMLSDEQMDELEAARGAEFDRLFLTYMIQHHEGAVAMVHDLFEVDGAAQDDLVFKVASDIQVDQITEIARMKSMLASLTSRRGRGGR